MARAVFATARSEEQANRMVTGLKAAGFSSSDISVLMPDPAARREVRLEQHTKAGEGTAAGAATGVVLGGALGWLAGIGALVIPGLGAFIAAGPIMAALSGAVVGAGLGGLTGMLVGLGIPEDEARRYEERVRAGDILVSVHTEDPAQRALAEDVLGRAGADDVTSGPRSGAADERYY
jgi:hypothetical protein